jgi:hypothetical protein
MPTILKRRGDVKPWKSKIRLAAWTDELCPRIIKGITAIIWLTEE